MATQRLSHDQKVQLLMDALIDGSCQAARKRYQVKWKLSDEDYRDLQGEAMLYLTGSLVDACAKDLHIARLERMLDAQDLAARDRIAIMRELNKMRGYYAPIQTINQNLNIEAELVPPAVAALMASPERVALELELDNRFLGQSSPQPPIVPPARS